MKHLSRTILAVLMAVLIGTLFPVQVFADTPDYISEVKVFAGDYAAAETEGYTLLKNGDNPVDLNENAGGGFGSKGDKAVYLGYKTTKERSEAITDLALMNMKGGYSVMEYDALMETHLASQVLPFIENFKTTLKEYRTNYNAKNGLNKAKAKYVHDALNQYIDDDTGKPLGDLFLNETKEEMGEEAYNALSDEEKKEHADLSTIIMQANGEATLMFENLVTRAADTNANTWLERLTNVTYDDLIDQTGMSPTDAEKSLAKLYDDCAMTVLDKWEVFSNELASCDDMLEIIENYDDDEIQKAFDDFKGITEDMEAEEAADIVLRYGEAQAKVAEYNMASELIMIHEYLATVEYNGGTLLDFFSRSAQEAEESITELYPIAAVLTAGQRAGLEFLSLRELCSIALTDEQGYSEMEFTEFEQVSIYDSVDRGIYEKGGVALTNDALRKDVMAETEKEMLSKLSVTMMLLSSLAAAGVVASVGSIIASHISQAVYNSRANDFRIGKEIHVSSDDFAPFEDNNYERIFDDPKLVKHIEEGGTIESYGRALHAKEAAYNSVCAKLAIGLTVALIVLSAVTTYLAWNDMKAYYNVEFTPVPHYMVDEKDIVGYNAKGEKIMLKNQSAYYKAVDCNRTESDEMYNSLGTCADLNGDVGKQWLALYAVKNEVMEPILAGSLTAVVNSADIPAGYTTGIHMFGSDAAFNLNNNLYDWNNDAPSVYVYFKTDDTAASATGANFTVGSLALSGGAGIVFGAAFTALSMNTIKKKKESKTATV